MPRKREVLDNLYVMHRIARYRLWDSFNAEAIERLIYRELRYAREWVWGPSVLNTIEYD